VLQYYQQKNIRNITVEDIIIGNGVSELIVMAMQGLLNNNDEVLIQALITHFGRLRWVYRQVNLFIISVDESNDWQPDIEDIRSKISG